MLIYRQNRASFRDQISVLLLIFSSTHHCLALFYFQYDWKLQFHSKCNFNRASKYWESKYNFPIHLGGNLHITLKERIIWRLDTLIGVFGFRLKQYKNLDKKNEIVPQMEFKSSYILCICMQFDKGNKLLLATFDYEIVWLCELSVFSSRFTLNAIESDLHWKSQILKQNRCSGL